MKKSSRLVKYLNLGIIFAVLIFGINACNSKNNKRDFNKTAKEVIEPKTNKIDIAKYKTIVYVSSSMKGKPVEGNKSKPLYSIKSALNNIKDASANNRYAVFVAAGKYEEGTIKMKAFVDLFGGFNNKTWERNIKKYKTILSGKARQTSTKPWIKLPNQKIEEGRVVIAADNCTIDGFVIMGGKIRGKGAGILCDGVSPVITNNVFLRNKTLKPIPWNPKYWHKTANDGGAIYCGNGAAPVIENNYFIDNQTENGRGAGIAAADNSKPVIKNNVFFKNVAGLDDPMRSSDGGAISIFNRCNADIENNIILSNNSLAHNDAGGLWLALWSSAKIKNNIFVDNQAGDDAGAIFVGGQEHRYARPLDKMPPKDKFFISIENNIIVGNRNASMNSGAMRFTMEGRGEFKNNVTAQNNGIYFQRSEVDISGNIILDNFLLIETKPDLKEYKVTDNIIWANYNQQVKAIVKNNNIKNNPAGGNNYSQVPKFENDEKILEIASANYSPKIFTTTMILLNNNLQKNELVNRIVKIGNKWSVISSNDDKTITLWGNFSGAISVTVLPTYKIENNNK